MYTEIASVWLTTFIAFGSLEKRFDIYDKYHLRGSSLGSTVGNALGMRGNSLYPFG